jgi:ATP-binding cassette subfamily B protein
MLDNVSISDIPHHALRNLVGLVPQDTSLLNGSIAYNISIGKSGSTQEQIVEAAKAACLHDFVVTQTDGYATKVGERGLRLSGGERQRIAIARALLRHPRVLVLDEATSSLDPTTERRVCQRMRRALRNVTEVIIAHRLSAVVDVDEILVLDKGRIIERGTHTVLVRGDGLYADMWSAQQRVARGTIGQSP